MNIETNEIFRTSNIPFWNYMFSAGEQCPFLFMNCRLLGSLNSEYLKRYPLEGLGIDRKIILKVKGMDMFVEWKITIYHAMH
jgi:hypothetical protein